MYEFAITFHVYNLIIGRLSICPPYHWTLRGEQWEGKKVGDMVGEAVGDRWQGSWEVEGVKWPDPSLSPLTPAPHPKSLSAFPPCLLAYPPALVLTQPRAWNMWLLWLQPSHVASVVVVAALTEPQSQRPGQSCYHCCFCYWTMYSMF